MFWIFFDTFIEGKENISIHNVVVWVHAKTNLAEYQVIEVR